METKPTDNTRLHQCYLIQTAMKRQDQMSSRQQEESRAQTTSSDRNKQTIHNLTHNTHNHPNTTEQPNDDFGHSLTDILTTQNNNETNTPVWTDQRVRIYFQNINGLPIASQGMEIGQYFLHMKEVQADIFCFNETNLNSRHPTVINHIQKWKQKIWNNNNEQCKILHNNCELPWTRTYQPGGNLMGITSKMVGRIRTAFSDEYGRWMRCELIGRGGRTITVICAYQVAQTHESNGPTTTFSQRSRLMNLKTTNHNNPRQHFIQGLNELVTKLHDANHDIILCGDFNEEVGKKANQMARVINAGKLVDTFTQLHAIETETPTYIRGRKRLDYIFVSPRLATFIIAAGGEPFNYRIISDHRGIFVDFSVQGFFDRSPNALTNHPTRGLIPDVPRHVRSYLSSTAEYFQAHNVMPRVNQLLNGPEAHEAVETLDRDITRAMLAAETQIKTFRRAPWSPKFHETITRIHILNKQRTQIKLKTSMTSAIDRLQSTLGKPLQLPRTITELNKMARTTRQELRALTQQAATTAEQLLDEKISARHMAQPEVPIPTIRKQMINTMDMKRMYSSLPSIRPARSSGIRMIKIPIHETDDPTKGTTQFRTVTEPSEIETLLIKRNQQHFSQARDTPLAQPAVLSALGFGGTTETADAILNGSANITELTKNKHSQELLSQCKRRNPELTSEITTEQFVNSYRRWKVSTSTSPSGRHLGHQHLLFNHHGLPKEHPDKAMLEKSRSDNWTAQASIAKYATKWGYSVDRWRKVVNTMIEKEPGNPKLHRLRVIHIYESDYNTTIGIKIRELMHNCEDKEHLHPGAYGSRATRQALDPVLLEVLQYDYACLTRWPEVKFNNDTSACYDRHIPPINTLICRSLGLHKNIAKLQGHMLENTRYHIKTQLGVSSTSYSHSLGSPIYGTGQGNKGSAAFWTTLGCNLFKQYDQHCHGAKYTDAHQENRLKLGMDGFVDDNACNVNSNGPSENEIIKHACEDAQLWHDITWSGGQKLELSKCFCRILITRFHVDGTPYFLEQTEEDIKINDARGTPITLPQVSAYKAYRTLGTFQAATKIQTKQYEVLLAKSEQLHRLLALSNSHGHAAWTFYNSIVTKSLGYPLPVSRLTKTQLSTLQGPILSLLLTRMKYCSRISRALIHGPRNHGGLGIPSFESISGAQRILLLMRQIRCKGQPQILLRIVINRCQHNAGVGYNIFRYPKRRLPHLEGCWIPSIRTALVAINGHLEMRIHIPGLLRDGDAYIMDIAIQSLLFSNSDLKRLNYCRLYLQVITIADITNAIGTMLIIGIWEGNTATQQSKSTLREPHQARPDNGTWGIWRRFLRLISTKGKLHVPLGSWKPMDKTHRRRHYSVFSNTTNKLYKRFEADYTEHRPVRTNIHSFESNKSTTELPLDATPIDIEEASDGWRLRKQVKIQTKPQPQEPEIQTFNEYIASQDDHIALCLKNINLLDRDIHDIHDIASAQALLIASDGGAKDEYGAFGWTMSTINGTRLIKGSGPVFGLDPKSYRAECYGMKAALMCIHMMNQYCTRTPIRSQITFYCDNLGLIKKIRKIIDYPLATRAMCLHSEWDILTSIHNLHATLNTTIRYEHIQSHQDSKTTKSNLPLPAQLNIEADELASTEMEQFASPKPWVPFDPIAEIMLYINNIAITRNITNRLQTAEHKQTILQYYSNRFKWTTTTMETIDWQSYATAYRTYPRTRTFFKKFGWKKLPTKKRIHQREPHTDHRCTRCWEDYEDDDHLYQCQHDGNKGWNAQLLAKVTDTVGQFLQPDLLTLSKQGLLSYFHASPPPDLDPHATYYTQEIQTLIKEQTAIGWDQFLRGKWSKKWTEIQSEYALSMNLQKESRGWAIKCIKTFADESFRLWTQRNNHTHGHDTITRRQLQIVQQQHELKHLYTLQHEMRPQDRNIFFPSVEEHLQETPKCIKEWITFNKQYINISRRRARKNAKQKNHNITNFFPRTEKTPKKERPKTTRSRNATSTKASRNHKIPKYYPTTTNPRQEGDKRQSIRNQTTTNTTPQQQLNSSRHYQQQGIMDFFPDHPG